MPARLTRVSRPCGLAVIAVLSAACIGPQPWWQQDLQEWQGASVSELLDAWGPPLHTLTGDEDGTVLVYESARQLDHRLDELRDPSARLDPDRSEARYRADGRSECTLYFAISGEHVTAARHEGAACDIVPRDPARRHTDPVPARRR
ncbi:MAG TPA: hypothetical protein VMQ83_12365 [Gammaproteobacteria bacterium]|nr:hypothetical protein [Gammaproteobacteria bacterium]